MVLLVGSLLLSCTVSLTGTAVADALPTVAVQLDGPDRSVASGRPAHVIAHVIDAATGVPVSGVAVALSSHPTGDSTGAVSPEGSGTTDSAGAALFTVTPSGATTYSAVASAVASNDTVLSPQAAAMAGPVDAAMLTGGDATVSVSWRPPYDDGTGVTSYMVRAVPASIGGPPPPTLEMTTPTTSVTFTGAVNDDPYTVTVRPLTNGNTPDPQRPHDYGVGVVTPSKAAPAAAPTGGTDVCGTLLAPITTWSASGSPYRVCAAGVFVPLGSTLQLDGSAGPLQITGLHDVVVRGDVRTLGTSATDVVQFAKVGLRLGEDPTGLARPETQDHDPATADLGWLQFWWASLSGRGTFLGAHDVLVAGHNLLGVRTPGLAFYGGAADVSNVNEGGLSSDGVSLGAKRRARLVHATVNNVLGYGVRMCGGTVEETGLVISNTNTGQSGALPGPAVEMCSRHLITGAGSRADTITGSGNGLDGVALSGALGGDLMWQPVLNSSTEHPLGYLDEGLTVPAGTSLVVPTNTTLVAGADSLITVDGALTLQQGSRLTSAAARESRLPCPSVLATTCLPAAGPYRPSCVLGRCTEPAATWGGVEVRAGTLTATGATIDHANYGVTLGTGSAALQSSQVLNSYAGAIASASPGADVGQLSLRDSVIRWVARGPGVQVRAHDLLADSTTIADTDGPGLSIVAGSGNTTITNDAIVGAGGPGMTLSTTSHVTVSNDVIRRTRGLAAQVTGSGYTYGSGRDVQPLQGGGNELDAIVLEGTDSPDVPYGTPQQQDSIHALTPIHLADVPAPGTDPVSSVVVNETLTRDKALGISWTPGSYLMGGSVPYTGFELAVTGQPVRTLPPSATGYMLTGLTNGNVYTVHIRAVNNSTKGAWSSPARFGVPAPPPDPAVLTSVSFKPGFGALDARWTIGPTAWVLPSITGMGSAGGPIFTAQANSAHFFQLRQDRTYTVTLLPYDSYGMTGKPVRLTVLGTTLVGRNITIRRGQTASMPVRLTDQSTGTPLANQRLTVKMRRPGATTWTVLGTLTTDRNGGAHITARPAATTSYLISWAGSGNRLAAQRSATITVT